MIGLERSWALLLALPWLLLWLWLFGVQHRALVWIGAHVAPRFRRALTVHGRGSLRWHMILLLVMGLLLVVASAGPTLSGRGEARVEGGRLLLLLDASASMNASDVSALLPDREAPKDRLAQARRLAEALAGELEGWEIGMVTFSGVATIELPMTLDREVLAEALRVVEVHTFYQNTGSSLAFALEAVPPFVDDDGPLPQVLLLSDGEQPFAEDYAEPLRALAELDVAVHAVTLGSLEGQERQIFDFRDIRAKKKERGVLREFTTRRVDEHLARIASETGGRFEVASARSVGRLREAILRQPVSSRSLEDERLVTDLSPLPLLLFLIGLLVDGLLIGRRGKPSYDFDLDRLSGSGPPASALVLILLLVAGCGHPAWEAHVENERGIARDVEQDYLEAWPHYERSRAVGFRPEVPIYNQGRSALYAGDPEGAHDLFQQALSLAPEMPEAFHNDGVALYNWGQAERDPEGCFLDRTLDLWEKAQQRFDRAVELLEPDSLLGQAAEADYAFVAEQIAALEALIGDPPLECGDSPPPPPPAGSPPPPEGSPPPPSGGADPPPPEPPPPPPRPPPMTGDDLGQVQQELQRIAEQKQQEGKYYRRTREEQFRPEDWQSPEAEIWW